MHTYVSSESASFGGIRRLCCLTLAGILLSTLFGAALQSRQKPPSKATYTVYFGTTRRGKGIYISRLDTATGKLSPPELVVETLNPSFLAVHPNRKFLYAVNETNTFQEQKSGSVSAFAIAQKTGRLTLQNQVASRGTPPGHLIVDRSARNVLVGNFGSGSVTVLPLRPDGSLAEASVSVQHSGSGANPKRQQGPHVESVNLSADNRFAIVTDLGQDKLFVYRFNLEKGSLSPNEPPYAAVHPGAGPRHFTFHPNGRFGYVINELDSTITAFGYDSSRGVLNELQTITTLPSDFTGNNSGAEVQVHPSGRFLYGSNRGHNSIAIFSIDPAKGTLAFVEHVSTQGKTPRHFGIDPSGSFLLAVNQDTDNIVVFRIDQQTGHLVPTGQMFEILAPTCVLFLPLR